MCSTTIPHAELLLQYSQRQIHHVFQELRWQWWKHFTFGRRKVRQSQTLRNLQSSMMYSSSGHCSKRATACLKIPSTTYQQSMWLAGELDSSTLSGQLLMKRKLSTALNGLNYRGRTIACRSVTIVSWSSMSREVSEMYPSHLQWYVDAFRYAPSAPILPRGEPAAAVGLPELSPVQQPKGLRSGPLHLMSRSSPAERATPSKAQEQVSTPEQQCHVRDADFQVLTLRLLDIALQHGRVCCAVRAFSVPRELIMIHSERS